jgi:hypothetical protein
LAVGAFSDHLPTMLHRTRTVRELVERWLEWRQQVRPISPVTVANYRGAISRYITPNLGRVHEVDAATQKLRPGRIRDTH